MSERHRRFEFRPIRTIRFDGDAVPWVLFAVAVLCFSSAVALKAGVAGGLVMLGAGCAVAAFICAVNRSF